MIISDEAVEEFRQLYRDEYGEELSVEEAREEASHLLDLYRILARPLPSEVAEHERKLREVPKDSSIP